MRDNVWDQVLSRLQARVNRESFRAWFKPTAFIADDGRLVTVGVPSALFRDWITKHYSSVIAVALDEVHRSDALITFVALDSLEDDLSRDRRLDDALDRRFEDVHRELGAIRRDISLILARLG